MDFFNTLIEWAQGLLKSGGQIISFLTTNIDFGVFHLSPLALLTIEGLYIYFTVAVVKWLIV